MLKNIEAAGRTCYKSEDKITEFEHEKVTVRIICDRGVSHEIVRHRLAAYSQESTRYCNYSGEKFGNEITVIEPFFFNKYSALYGEWETACRFAEREYFRLLDNGATPQQARSVLLNSLKTEIVVTYDLREWRHFFTLRTAKTAHPQMQQIAIPLLLWFKAQLYPLFEDIPYNADFNQFNYARIYDHTGESL